MLKTPLPPPEFPPLDGSLSIMDIVEFNSVHNALHPAFLFCFYDTPDTVTEISYLEFGRAVHRAAHVVNPEKKRATGSVVAIIANLDSFVYQALVLGIIQAGLVAFPISPRNSSAAILHLLNSTSCHTIFSTPATLEGLIEDMQLILARENPDFALEVNVAPMITQIYPNLGKENAEHSFLPYPNLHGCFDPAAVCLYLHSSGTTGFPKAIPVRFRTPVEWGASRLTKLRKHEPRIRLGTMALPPFHGMAFIMQVVYPICGLIAASVFPPEIWREDDEPHPHTGDDILQQIRRTRSNSAIMTPMTLEGMVKSSVNIEHLSTLQYVAYGGGPLSKTFGDSLVASRVNLQPSYGSTEMACATLLRLDRHLSLDWEWIEFSDYVNMRWVPQGNGTYEAQCLTTNKYHPLVENLEDTKGYATSDLFIPHPTLERVWKIVGRKDEVIVHSSGEKTVPAPMERVMTGNGVINGAVVFGHGHVQAGVLIEPVTELSTGNTNDPVLVAEFLSRAWPFIEKANKDAPAFSKIFKEMVLVVSSRKPLPRSPKGSVMKKLAIQMYKDEIKELYRKIESNIARDDIILPKAWNKDAVQSWLLQQAKDIRSKDYIDSARDLFEQGFDSISETFLRSRIAGALNKAPNPPNHANLLNIVYNHPTIANLASYMASFFQDHDDNDTAQSPTSAIESMIKKYSAGSALRRSLENPLSVISQSAGHVMLITGTTGNLGSHVLALLLQRSDVTRIYASNRSSGLGEASSRLLARFKDKGLDTELLKLAKLTLLECDLAQEGLGLAQDIYTEESMGTVQSSITVVIHAAWRLDFNLALASFESNIRGTRNLIDLVRGSPNPHRVRFLYTSSIGSAQGWDPKRGQYPEEVVYDSRTAVGSGYGESKYVAERILANSGLPRATSLRIGQISGGLPNGAWPTSDWVPILIKSSLALAALPDLPGEISWLPAEVVAQCILDLAFSSEMLPVAMNIVHPRPLSWTEMFTQIREELIKILQLEKDTLSLIPFKNWIRSLEERNKVMDDEKLRKMPATKLPEFFRKMANSDVETPAFATDKSQNFSPTLSGLGELLVNDAERWIRYWHKRGYICAP